MIPSDFNYLIGENPDPQDGSPTPPSSPPSPTRSSSKLFIAMSRLWLSLRLSFWFVLFLLTDAVYHVLIVGMVKTCASIARRYLALQEEKDKKDSMR